jgi:hypothetical protein
MGTRVRSAGVEAYRGVVDELAELFAWGVETR